MDKTAEDDQNSHWENIIDTVKNCSDDIRDVKEFAKYLDVKDKFKVNINDMSSFLLKI